MYENLENSGYPVSPDTSLTQVGNISSSGMETIENKWSQFMSHDNTSFNFPVEPAQFCSQYGTISYPPSKVTQSLFKTISKKYENVIYFFPI